MEYRQLGPSGCLVSSFALGTMTFGSETDEQASHLQLDFFIESGGNLIDLADVYSGGQSEEITGRWLAKKSPRDREQLILASKARFPLGSSPNESGLSRKHLTHALDNTLRRLGTETVDLYQVHSFDPLTPLDETLRFLDDAVRSGKVLYTGLSNFTGWQIQKAVGIAAALGIAGPVSVQPQYSLLAREVEWEIIPACLDGNLGLLPWSPLGGGWLTGKYQKDVRPSGATRLGENPERGVEAYSRRSAVERTWQVIDAVRGIADTRGISMAQVALAWLADRPTVASVIIGARSAGQLKDNLGAAGLHLSAGEIEQLDSASDPDPADYPYGPAGTQQRSRTVSA